MLLPIDTKWCGGRCAAPHKRKEKEDTEASDCDVHFAKFYLYLHVMPIYVQFDGLIVTKAALECKFFH